MTITTNGVDADGHPISNVRVYDRKEADRKSGAGAGSTAFVESPCDRFPRLIRLAVRAHPLGPGSTGARG
jgi:hypothetical protein